MSDLREDLELALDGKLEDKIRREEIKNNYNKEEELQSAAYDVKAKKKKPLPDHRPPVGSSLYYRPTEKDVSDLVEKYGFMPDFPLRDRLVSAYTWEETARNLLNHQLTPGNQKAQLKALRDRCHAVEEVVSKLGVEERRVLSEEFPDHPNLESFKEDAHNLYRASLHSLAKLKNQRSPRPKRENIWNFVRHLADIWSEGTWTDPTTGYDDISERYIGDFYNFVLQCADLGSIELSQGDPGGTIVNILKEWRQRK